MENQEIIQITAVGDGYVGKTCMLFSFTEKRPPVEYEPTVFENYAGKLSVDDREHNIQLWDTAGQEDYDRLRPLCYNQTRCFLLCFSVNEKTSFENIAAKWVPEIKHFKPSTPIILVGTKCDMRSDPEMFTLPKVEGVRMKESIRAAKYMECSAVTREGIDEIFEEAVRVVLSTKIKRARSCSVL